MVIAHEPSVSTDRGDPVKTITRTASTIGAAIIAALASVFVATPAFAAEEVEKFDPAAQFSTAGEPLQVGAILIVGIVLLAIVLILAQLVGNLFEKK